MRDDYDIFRKPGILGAVALAVAPIPASATVIWLAQGRPRFTI